jgi:alkylhydroperoxidase/carboxymuconolactone decarboxylase family protein YurZ
MAAALVRECQTLAASPPMVNTMRNEGMTLGTHTIDGSWIMAKGENPVLSTLLDINAVSLERTELDPQSLILIRLAALIAVDAPVSSYLLHLGAGAQAGLTLEQAQDVLVAVAPIAGTPRTASAAAKLAEALGLAIDIAESELSA